VTTERSGRAGRPGAYFFLFLSKLTAIHTPTPTTMKHRNITAAGEMPDECSTV